MERGGTMKIFDAHCDVLYKMWLDKSLSFKNSSQLHINLNHLLNFDRSVQCFALYIPEHVPFENRFQACIQMIDIFYEKIIKKYPEIRLVTSKEDMLTLKEGEVGAVLTLEGCDSIGNDLTKLRTLYRLGVTSIGLTWNYANLVADGALEQRNGGLTEFGKTVVKENNRANIWTDVSHLCEQSFWDTIEYAEFPIASHSNSYSICGHVRNLKDSQIKALLDKGGLIGLTFVPDFIDENGQASISKIIKHLDHICSLGGENQVGFGSDFDGIMKTVPDLENYSKYTQIIEQLLRFYSEDQVNNFLYNNFVSGFPK